MSTQVELHEMCARLGYMSSNVPRARRLLRAALAEWGVMGDPAQSAELIVSELITNALRVVVPVERTVGMRLAYEVPDSVLQIEVSDAGDGKPELQSPGRDETGGRGLLIVEALAQRWGVRAHDDSAGKTVWAEVSAPRMTYANRP